MWKRRWVGIIGLSALLMAHGATADEWRFGLGTGFSSFSLNGDIGIPTPTGGIIADVDLSNSDTSDMIDSGLGVAGFAANGLWTIQYTVGRVQMEDSDSGLDARWDRTQAEVAAIYTFAQQGDVKWGALFGVRYTDHDWRFKFTGGQSNSGADWTDAVVGVTASVPLAEKWTWINMGDVGFGGSDGTYRFRSGVNWRALDHWMFNVYGQYLSTEYGDKSDRNKSDFYYYKVDEPSFGIGFMYTW